MVLVIATMPRLGRGIMPMLRDIAAIGGAAGDVDDPAASPRVAEMETASRLKSAADCRLMVIVRCPGGVPFVVAGIVGDGFVNAGIVDEHVDPAAELARAPRPRVARRGGIGEVAGDQLVAAARGMADDIVAGRLEQRVSGRADAAARSGDEDVHGLLCISERSSNAIQS